MSEHVPTAAELVKMGLARRVEVSIPPSGKQKKPRKASWIVISDEGHALLGEIMRRNAEEAIASGSSEWKQPPSSGRRRQDWKE